jgi:hypothetical protein
MFKLSMVVVLPLSLFSQQPVSSYTIDADLYEGMPGCCFIRSPLSEISYPYGSFFSSVTRQFGTEYLQLFHRKGTDEYAIFSFTGNCGTIRIPASVTPSGGSISGIDLSQTFIDADSGWEAIVRLYPGGSRVVDENGTVLLSDSSSLCYGCDGQSTYVFKTTGYEFKAWRFRTNFSTPVNQPLAKSASAARGPMMAYLPTGDLRVQLQPAPGGTSVQLFDMLGRQLYQRIIPEKTPASFTIPQTALPNSPYISKISTTAGTWHTGGVPVR